MKYLVILPGLCLGTGMALAQGIDHQKQIEDEQGRALPPCERLISHIELCRKLREAREIAQGVPLKILEVVEQRLKKDGKPEVVRKSVRREFAIVAYDPLTDQLHTIVLDMPLVGNDFFQPVVQTKHDPPYQVTRIKGQTFIKMVFRITMGDRPLYAYAANHLSVPPAFRSQGVEAMTREAEPRVYLATPPYLANDEFGRLGRTYAMGEAEEGLNELRNSQVPSKALPGKLVADIITPKALLNFLVTEQTDPCLLVERDPGCAKLLPQSLYERDEQVTDAVLTEFVLNGFDAYRYICSPPPANACGYYQFTNTWKQKLVADPKHPTGKRVEMVPGTYDAMRREYPTASLDPEFRRGTRGFRNSAKAAALLIDYELSSPKVPDWVRRIFVDDQRIGLLFPAMAYNGGPSQSQALARLMSEFQRLRGIPLLHFDTFPWQEFALWIKTRNLAVKKGQPLVLKWETLGYLRKFVANWNHFERYTWQERRR